MNAYIATLVTFIIIFAFRGLMGFLAQRGWVESKLSHQIAHIGGGPIFVVCWLLYPDGPLGPWLASLVPLLAALQFALLGLGIATDQKTINALTDSGDHREMLLGPLFYSLMFIALTLFYWRDSPIGIPALMMLCGSWIAGVLAPQIKSMPWPWSSRHSVAGSVITFIAGWLLTLIVFAIYLGIGALAAHSAGFFYL